MFQISSHFNDDFGASHIWTIGQLDGGVSLWPWWGRQVCWRHAWWRRMRQSNCGGRMKTMGRQSLWWNGSWMRLGGWKMKVLRNVHSLMRSDEVWWGLMMSDVVGVAVYGCLWPFWGKVRLRDVLMVVANFLIFKWEAEAASAATVDRRVCDWQISPLHVTRFLETLERLFQVAIPSCNCAHKTWPKTWPGSRATCEATQQKMQSCSDLKRHFQAQTMSWVDEVDFHLLDPFSIWKRQHQVDVFRTGRPGDPNKNLQAISMFAMSALIWWSYDPGSRMPEVCEVRFASLLRRWSGFHDVWIPRKRKSDNLSSSSWKRTLCYKGRFGVSFSPSFSRCANRKAERLLKKKRLWRALQTMHWSCGTKWNPESWPAM